MKPTIIILIFCLSFSVSATRSKALESISELQWSNRVLLIFGGNDYIPQLNAQLDEINERHIKWFLFNEESVTSNHVDDITKEFVSSVSSRYKSEGTVLVLIGKDGGVKSRRAEFDLPLIFELIDSMPMRLEEVQRLKHD